MKWHPILNASAALIYITLVALFMRFIESIRHDTPDTFIDGMGFLSLFTFSAAAMTFLFFYQPVRLLIEKKPTEAITYFLKTLGIFGMAMATLLTLASLQ
jgi:hypothetical protein